jgi:hypothetical protein
MFWIFLLLILVIIVGCYVTYKEAKHHELHKMRACFVDIEDKIKALKENTLTGKDKDPEASEVFEGESIGIEKALEVISREDADCDLIQEIENDLEMIKEKVAGLFKK